MQVAETESSCRYRISVAFAFVVLLQMHQHQQKSTTGPLSTTCWSAQSKCWLLSLLIQAWETHHRACRYWPVPWYQLIWREWYKKCWGSDWQHINQQEGMENAKRDIHQEKKYFHGCASHGLDLIVKDILVATKKKSTYLFPVKDSNSSWKTLYVPVYLSKSINILEPIQEGIVQIQSLSLSLMYINIPATIRVVAPTSVRCITQTTALLVQPKSVITQSTALLVQPMSV